MICVSIQDKCLSEIEEILSREDVRMAEIRLDSCNLGEEDVEYLFSSSDKPLVATLRDDYSEDAERYLALAIAAGAAYVDLDIETPAPMGRRLRQAAAESGTVVVRSFHDFHGTPPGEELREIADTCLRYGAQIVKIVTTAAEDADWTALKSLYGDYDRLIAFCMGEEGRDSRVECLALGAPFTYASLEEGDETAPGQMTIEEMNSKVYGTFKHLDCNSVELPCSKSFAQRAILVAALAEGTSHLSGYTPCTDSEAAIKAAKTLGAEVRREGNMLIITGIGPIREKIKLETISAGESGLLSRMLIPIVAAIAGNPGGGVTVTGEKTLLARPLSDANDIMSPFGVILTPADSEGTVRDRRTNDIYLPLRVEGTLIPGRAEISGAAGSQLISGLLTALPLCRKPSMVYVNDPTSIPYMFLTLEVLRHFDVTMANEMEGDEEFIRNQDWSHCSATSFKIKGGQGYHAADIDLEKDWSAAANLLVAGALFGSAKVSGLDENSLQADLSIVDILVDAGATASQDEDGSINVARGPLTAINVDLTNSPDLFPIVSILCAFCSGTSRLKGAGRLIHKESNRAQSIVVTLGRMGVTASVEGDCIVICGMPLEQRILSGKLLKGGSYTSFHDHRMVLALAVSSRGASSPVSIDDVDCVAKSWPGFMKLDIGTNTRQL